MPPDPAPSASPASPASPTVLAGLAEIGPFFAVASRADGEGWQPLSALHDPSRSDLRVAVARARATLTAQSGAADIDERVAASLWFLGWSARLVSIWLGAAAVLDLVPALPATDIWWRASPGQPVPLAVTSASYAEVGNETPTSAAQRIYDTCINVLIEPLLRATAETWSLSHQVLWGNVASALSGAADVLATDPARAARTRSLAHHLLLTGQLVGRGDAIAGRFVRHSCCLLYRVPGFGLCADCVLLPARAGLDLTDPGPDPATEPRT